METAISVLALVAIGLGIVLIIVVIFFITFAKKVLQNLDSNIGQVTKDIHSIKEQSVDFMFDVHKFIKKANNIAETIEELKQPMIESIDNIKHVSREAKGILHVAKGKTEEFAYGLKSITDSLYEGYMRVVQPIQRISTIISQVSKGASKMSEIFKKKKEKHQPQDHQEKPRFDD